MWRHCSADFRSHADAGMQTCGNSLSLIALTVLPLAGLMNRMRVEEAALAEALGPASHAIHQHGKAHDSVRVVAVQLDSVGRRVSPVAACL
jgi:hypothetical protein